MSWNVGRVVAPAVIILTVAVGVLWVATRPVGNVTRDGHRFDCAPSTDHSSIAADGMRDSTWGAKRDTLVEFVRPQTICREIPR